MLSDTTVRHLLSKGELIIEPFIESQLKNVMYDVTLGEFFYRSNSQKTWSPTNQESINEYWGQVQKACPAEEDEWASEHLPGTKVIRIEPGELLLCHTQEIVGTRSQSLYTTQLNTRSTMARCGLRFCCCAGQGDIGFHDRWTLEVENASRAPIIMPVGMRVAAVSFHQVSELSSDDYSLRGSYSSQKEWEPTMMLPVATKN